MGAGISLRVIFRRHERAPNPRRPEMNAVFAWPRMMSSEEATAYAGGPTIFADLLKKKLLKPREQRKGLTRYDRLDVDGALDAWKGLDAE
jgi:hypothetical protein